MSNLRPSIHITDMRMQQQKLSKRALEANVKDRRRNRENGRVKSRRRK